jgi:hypothetical protein
MTVTGTDLTTARELEPEVTAASATQPTLAHRQAAGLRALADMIEANPELADHAGYLDASNVFYVQDKAAMAAIARAALAHGFEVMKDAFGDVYKVLLKHGPVGFAALASRGEVCERVVTGTREVAEEIPDPVALAAVPTTTVTRVVEDVEWICKPLLAVSSDTEGGGADD